MSTKKLTILALYTTLALAIYVAESAIPPLVPIPGIKPGFANIVTLFVLSHHSVRDALWVLLARILLAGFLFGQGISILYSLTGGICCLIIMSFLQLLLHKHWLPLTSIFGALAHNLGQLLLAGVVLKSFYVISYLPYLILSAMVTGLFTGLCAYMANRFISPHIKHLSSE